MRLAAVKSPGYITIPQLGWSQLSAIFPLWTLLNDATQKSILLHCLRSGDIDEFLYRAAFLKAEREVLDVAWDIGEIFEQQASGDEKKTSKSLPNIHRVATRLKTCVQENRTYEDNLRRASAVLAASYPSRNEFEKLAIRFSELDNSLIQCHYRQMTNLTATGTRENLRQTKATNRQAQATYEQTRSMSTLTWLAFVYVPLTFVTGIFGMNVKEIDPGSPLSWHLFAKIALAFLVVTLVVTSAYHDINKWRGTDFDSEDPERGRKESCWRRKKSKAERDNFGNE